MLEWDPLQLATAKLKSLALYRNGTKAGSIPRPMEIMSTKISGLAVDTEYSFQLVLRTTAGTYSSPVLTCRTHKMTDLSGITVTPGILPEPLRASLETAVERIGGKITPTVQIDTTHFICTEGRGKEWERAVETSVPVVRPEWIEGCEREGKIVGVTGYYLDANPKHRQVGSNPSIVGTTPAAAAAANSSTTGNSGNQSTGSSSAAEGRSASAISHSQHQHRSQSQSNLSISQSPAGQSNTTSEGSGARQNPPHSSPPVPPPKPQSQQAPPLPDGPSTKGGLGPDPAAGSSSNLSQTISAPITQKINNNNNDDDNKANANRNSISSASDSVSSHSGPSPDPSPSLSLRPRQKEEVEVSEPDSEEEEEAEAANDAPQRSVGGRMKGKAKSGFEDGTHSGREGNGDSTHDEDREQMENVPL